MTIRQLTDAFTRLNVSTTLATNYQNASQSINLIAAAEMLTGAVSPYTLVVSDPSGASRCLDRAQNILVVYGDAPAGPVRDPGKNIICVRSSRSPSDLAAALSALLQDDSKFEADCQALTDALLSGRGLQNITDTASLILENPAWVIDVNYSFLSKPSVDLLDDPWIIEEIELGYVLNRNVEDLKERQIFEQIQKTGKPYRYSVHTDPRKQIIAAPIRVKSVTVGYIQLFNSKKEYGPRDTDLLEHMSRLIAIELQKTPEFEVNKGVTHSLFLNDLLNGKFTNSDGTRERMKMLGITLGKSFQVLVIETGEREMEQHNTRTIAEQVHFNLLNSIYVIRNGKIIFLINLYRTTEIEEDCKAEIIRHLKRNGLRAGLSPIFSDILSCPQYYEMACSAIDLGPRVQPDAFIDSYSDLFLYHLLDQVKNRIPIEQLDNGCLQLLAEHDAQHGTDLLHTLHCFLSVFQSIPRSAGLLGIHVNTMRYRVDKIKELTHISLDDDNTVLRLMLAFKWRTLARGESKFGHA